MGDADIYVEAGKGFMSAVDDPLTAFMFFVIVALITAVGILYRRNQKQNDDTVALVKDTSEIIRESVKTLAVLSERIEHAVRSKS